MPTRTQTPSRFAVVADDGCRRWTVRFDPASRDVAVAAIDAAREDGVLGPSVAAALRRHVAWTCHAGLTGTAKPVQVDGNVVTVVQDSPTTPETP